MRLITIINLLSLLFTPIKPNNINSVGGETTLVNPIETRYSNEQLLGVTTREMGMTGDGYSPAYLCLEGGDYIYYISTYFIANSDAPILNDIIISTIFPRNTSAYLNVWEFTIISSDTFLYFSQDISSLDALTFDYRLKNDYNSSNYDCIYYYHIQTDFVAGQYNYLVFRCECDYPVDMFTGDSYGSYVYNYSYWYSQNHNFESYLESDVALPSFAWIPNNLFSSDSYFDGYLAGQNSVDTDIYFQQGVDSVNVNAIYSNAYNDGYNAGLTESSHDYGISNLLFSIFDIPIIVMSNLFSFTIFGTEVWGLLVSLMFVSFILFVTLKLLGKTSE